MTSLHKNQVKCNSNITISHTGGQLSSDSGHVTNLEVPDQFISIVENFFLGE